MLSSFPLVWAIFIEDRRLGAGSLLVTKEGDSAAGPAEGIPCGAVPQVHIPTPPPHGSHTCFDPKQIRCGSGGVM